MEEGGKTFLSSALSPGSSSNLSFPMHFGLSSALSWSIRFTNRASHFILILIGKGATSKSTVTEKVLRGVPPTQICKVGQLLFVMKLLCFFFILDLRQKMFLLSVHVSHPAEMENIFPHLRIFLQNIS